MKKIILSLLVMFSLIACTENAKVKQYGGQAEIELEPNQRLVNVTWKESNLWLLVKYDTTKPNVYVFEEKSQFGVLEGSYIIKEK